MGRFIRPNIRNYDCSIVNVLELINESTKNQIELLVRGILLEPGQYSAGAMILLNLLLVLSIE